MSNEIREQVGRIKRDAPRAQLPLPLIGKVKIGEKRKNDRGTEYPVSLDYFVASGDYAPMFREQFGEKPSRIQVIFISDDNNQSCLEEWDGRDAQGRRAGYSNGETFFLYNPNTEQYDRYHVDEHNEIIKQYSKDNKITWKVVLTLHFVIPAIKGVFGVWRFQTRGSKSSIGQIVQAFDMVKDSAGTIVNIPFDLVVEKVKSQKPGKKNTFPVVSLIPNISGENMEVLREYLGQGGDIKRLGQVTPEKLMELKPGDDVG